MKKNILFVTLIVLACFNLATAGEGTPLGKSGVDALKSIQAVTVRALVTSEHTDKQEAQDRLKASIAAQQAVLETLLNDRADEVAVDMMDMQGEFTPTPSEPIIHPAPLTPKMEPTPETKTTGSGIPGDLAAQALVTGTQIEPTQESDLSPEAAANLVQETEMQPTTPQPVIDITQPAPIEATDIMPVETTDGTQTPPTEVVAATETMQSPTQTEESDEEEFDEFDFDTSDLDAITEPTETDEPETPSEEESENVDFDLDELDELADSPGAPGASDDATE